MILNAFSAECRILLSSQVKVKGKVMKHFDQNKDGVLSPYENSLYKTQQHFGYKLAKKKKHKAYDFNGNLMLEPYEYQRFKQDKASGTLKKYKENPVLKRYQVSSGTKK